MLEKFKQNREEKKNAKEQAQKNAALEYWNSRLEKSEAVRDLVGEAATNAMVDSYKKEIEALLDQKSKDDEIKKESAVKTTPPKQTPVKEEKPSFWEKAKSKVRKARNIFLFGAVGLTGVSEGSPSKSKEDIKPHKEIHAIQKQNESQLKQADEVEKTIRTKDSVEVKPTEEETPLTDSTTLNTYTYKENGNFQTHKIIEEGMDTTDMYKYEDEVEVGMEANLKLEGELKIPKELLKNIDTEYYRESDEEAKLSYLWRATHLENSGAWVMVDKSTGKFDVFDQNNMPVVSTSSLTSKLHKDYIDTVKTSAESYFNTPAGVFSFQNVTKVPGHEEYKSIYHVNVPTSDKKDLGIYIHQLLNTRVSEQEKQLKSSDKHATHGCVRLRDSDFKYLAKYFEDGKKHVITIKHEEKTPGMVTWTHPITGEKMITDQKAVDSFKNQIIETYMQNHKSIMKKIGDETYYTGIVYTDRGREKMRKHSVKYTLKVITVKKESEKVFEENIEFKTDHAPQG